MEKFARRKWKEQFEHLSDKSKHQLIVAGVHDYDRELNGLKQGNNNLMKKYNISIDKTREAFYEHNKEGLINQSRKIFNNYKGKKAITKFGDTPKKQFKGIYGKVRERNKPKFLNKQTPSSKTYEGKGKQSYIYIPDHIPIEKFTNERISDKNKDYLTELAKRHEIDEIAVKKNGKNMFPVFSHNSPEILVRESALLALSPHDVQKVEKSIRTKSTESDFYKKITGKDFGRSAVFSRKENRLAMKNAKILGNPMAKKPKVPREPKKQVNIGTNTVKKLNKTKLGLGIGAGLGAATLGYGLYKHHKNHQEKVASDRFAMLEKLASSLTLYGESHYNPKDRQRIYDSLKKNKPDILLHELLYEDSCSNRKEIKDRLKNSAPGSLSDPNLNEDIYRFAYKHNIPIHGIDLDSVPQGLSEKDKFKLRETHMTNTIKDILDKNPNKNIAVVVGDTHLRTKRTKELGGVSLLHKHFVDSANIIRSNYGELK